MDVLRQFTFTIQYLPGTSTGNADALSRQAWSSSMISPNLRDASLQGGGDVGTNKQATQQQAAQQAN